MVISGLVIVVLAATGLRRLVSDAVPMQLKLAITAGIGLFIPGSDCRRGVRVPTGQPSPPVGLGTGGNGSITTIPTIVFVVTLLLTGVLVARRVRGGILIGLAAGTVIAIAVEAIWHLGWRWTIRAGGDCRCPSSPGPLLAWPDLRWWRLQFSQLQPHRGARRDGPGVHPGVRQLLRRPGEP